MADNYTQFSEALMIETDEEEAWLKALFEDGRNLRDSGEEDPGRYRKFLRNWGIPEMSTFVPGSRRQALSETAMYGWPGFGYRFEHDTIVGHPGRYLWMWDGGESGEVENVAAIVQAFIRKFHKDKIFKITWANTCSKPRFGEFSGGGLVVSAKKIKWFGAYNVIEQYANAYHRGKSHLNEDNW